RLAAPALDVEAEPARRVAAGARFLGRGEELADRREEARVRRRIRARRAADRALADVDHAVDVLEPLDRGDGRRILAALVDALGGALVQRVVDERALAGPRDPRHARHEPDGELDDDALKVVTGRAAQADHDVRIERPPRRGQRNPPAARQVLARQRRRIRTDLVRRALRDDLAAVRARARAEIDYVIGREDRLAVVLDDHHRVAEVAQVEQRAEQALVIALMQADRRLVEDVHDADEPRADLA